MSLSLSLMTCSNFPGAEIRGAEDDGHLLVPGRAQPQGGARPGDGPGQRPGQRQHLGEILTAAAHRSVQSTVCLECVRLRSREGFLKHPRLKSKLSDHWVSPYEREYLCDIPTSTQECITISLSLTRPFARMPTHVGAFWEFLWQSSPRWNAKTWLWNLLLHTLNFSMKDFYFFCTILFSGGIGY